MYAPTLPVSLVGLRDRTRVTRTRQRCLFEKSQETPGALGRLTVHPGNGGC